MQLRGGRRKARELALRALYQMDVTGITTQEALTAVIEPEQIAEETVAFAHELVYGVSQHRLHIDDTIKQNAKGWTLERMANIDRNVLRLAIYELSYMPDTPPSVVVDEAIELAKKYSTGESGRFVNGVLGNVVRHLETKRAD